MGPCRSALQRTCIAGLAGALLLSAAACSSGDPATTATTTAGAEATDPAELAAEAYVWGYPLVVSARTFNQLGQLLGVNRLFNQQELSDVTTRVIVAPNQDTLYSVATVDLRSGPLVLTVPDVTDRYWTYEMLDSWTEAFAYVGTRATGGKGGTFVITPPEWTGDLPAGAEQITSPTDQMFLLGRFLVSAPPDIAKVLEVTGQITFEPLDTPAPPFPPLPAASGSPQQVADAGIGFFDELGDALAVNPPTTDAARDLLAELEPLGIGPGRHPSTEVTDPTTRAILTEAVADGDNQVEQFIEENDELVNGWLVDTAGGRYGDDFMRRAAVAKVGWGENVPEEAVYPRSTVDGSGDPYDGAKRYRLHFDASELPPVDAFWSLTLYGPDGFFTANSINRYAIGDRTPGLTKNSDGSLDLLMQHDPPVGREGNWLPAPAGPFSLMLRLYLPQPSVLDGTWRVPAVAQG